MDSLINVLLQKNNLPHKIFSFDLLDDYKPTFFLGNLSNKFSNNIFLFVDLFKSEKQMWKIELDKFLIEIGGVTVDICEIFKEIGEQCFAVIDSGTSHFGAPFK